MGKKQEKRKFKVGDEVVVVGVPDSISSKHGGYYSGDVGTIVGLEYWPNYRVNFPPEVNNPYPRHRFIVHESELEIFYLSKSPLWKALS